uniref:Uncharacterized protein n=1 Tax=Dechloromonas aromatica (strain RCB) TaxID=159087 RepID=Q47D47_DECAR
MLDDLTKEIKAQLYERVKSPLFGAFAFSWVAWNYRALLALVSDLEFADKMAFIDKAYPTAWELSLHGALGPLISALLFLWLYPYPARFMYSYWAKQQKELKKVQQSIEDETPLTQEEANALRKAGFAQAKEYQSQLKELSATNKELEERMKLLQEENGRLATERDQFGEAAKKAQEQAAPGLASVLAQHPPSVSKDAAVIFPNGDIRSKGKVISIDSLSDEQRFQLTQEIGNGAEIQRVMLALVVLDGEGDFDSIAGVAGLGKIETRHGLEVLRSEELVSASANSVKWFLTSSGRSLAVRLGLREAALKVTDGGVVGG